MTETVDQAQAQPPRALAGVIEDATSLSFVSTSHFERSRGTPSPHGDTVFRQSSHISTDYPYTTSVDVNPRGCRIVCALDPPRRDYAGSIRHQTFGSERACQG
jgi:hypothetical protein